MAYNMTCPVEEYIPTVYLGEKVDLMQWFQNDEVNHAVDTILVSTDTNINVNGNDNDNSIDNGKRKRRPRNSDLSHKKKATKKTATAASPQQLVTAGTSQLQELIHQERIKQKQTHLIQLEENKAMFNTLSIELKDIRSTYEQMCSIKEKYGNDISIQRELSSCNEMWNEIVADIENRLTQIPHCKICSKSPMTNPPKVVGACGHKFCCKTCVSDYFKQMADSQSGKQLCLVCNAETDVTVFN